MLRIADHRFLEMEAISCCAIGTIKLPERQINGSSDMNECKSLKRNGGGDRTRTCIAFRPAVFKTAALPLCDPSAGWPKEYSADILYDQTRPRTTVSANPQIAPTPRMVHDLRKRNARHHRSDQHHQR